MSGAILNDYEFVLNVIKTWGSFTDYLTERVLNYSDWDEPITTFDEGLKLQMKVVRTEIELTKLINRIYEVAEVFNQEEGNDYYSIWVSRLKKKEARHLMLDLRLKEDRLRDEYMSARVPLFEFLRKSKEVGERIALNKYWQEFWLESGQCYKLSQTDVESCFERFEHINRSA